MEYHGISININQYHGISWNINQYHGISWNINQYHGISWNINQYHGISINIMEYQSISWNIMEYQSISWNIMEYQSISWNIMEYHAIGLADFLIVYFQIRSRLAHVFGGGSCPAKHRSACVVAVRPHVCIVFWGWQMSGFGTNRGAGFDLMGFKMI